jgi:lysophospholipase L1-like esterase
MISNPIPGLSARRTISFIAILLAVLSSRIAADDEPVDSLEKEVRAFEEKDRKEAPEPGGVLFLGSSSIRMWDTAKAFPDKRIINRGFGGSQIADSVHFAGRIAIPYKPRLIVFYAGDNDIAAGKSGDEVFADFKEFVGKVRSSLPETRIAFIAIKPSPMRWKFFDTQCRANDRIREFIKSERRLSYIDVVKPMLGDDGEPRRELFKKDNLHLNDEGYRVWVSVVKPFLDEK